MKAKINPLCDRIAAAAGVHPTTVQRLAYDLARQLTKARAVAK